MKQTAGAVFQNTHLFLCRRMNQIKRFLHHVEMATTWLLGCVCGVLCLPCFPQTEQVSEFETQLLECTAAYHCRQNGHCTFFSGENLRGSTMYKSSGPTKEGREGGRLKEWYGNYEHVTSMTWLASSRTYCRTNDQMHNSNHFLNYWKISIIS